MGLTVSFSWSRCHFFISYLSLPTKLIFSRIISLVFNKLIPVSFPFVKAPLKTLLLIWSENVLLFLLMTSTSSNLLISSPSSFNALYIIKSFNDLYIMKSFNDPYIIKSFNDLYIIKCFNDLYTIKSFNVLSIIKCFNDLYTIKSFNVLSIIKSFNDLYTIKSFNDLYTIKSFNDLYTIKSFDVLYILLKSWIFSLRNKKKLHGVGIGVLWKVLHLHNPVFCQKYNFKLALVHLDIITLLDTLLSCTDVFNQIQSWYFAWIPLTLSNHLSLSEITFGRYSRLYWVSAQSWFMQVFSGQPALVCPCLVVHKRTLLISLSLLLQQCPACFVHLGWFER